ncbi:hypothetical protein V1477_011029, partial [Vespula maculifrons]
MKTTMRRPHDDQGDLNMKEGYCMCVCVYKKPEITISRQRNVIRNSTLPELVFEKINQLGEQRCIIFR